MPTFIPTESLPEWPMSLPIAPLLASYRETHKSLTSSITTGNKSVIMRKVTTRVQKPMPVVFNFSKEEMTIFENFVYDTLEGGAVRFTFQHPRLKTIIEVTFDPSQENVFTIEPQDSMDFFKVSTQFLVWD